MIEPTSALPDTPDDASAPDDVDTPELAGDSPTPETPGLSPAACAKLLAEQFPALFGPESGPKPVKLRIQVDIQQRAPGVFSRRGLHQARRQEERQTEQVAQREQRHADDNARRERALLLRAFESSTLTKANFCALKGIAEPELDASLAQARQEREAPREMPRGPAREHSRNPARHAERRPRAAKPPR